MRSLERLEGNRIQSAPPNAGTDAVKQGSGQHPGLADWQVFVHDVRVQFTIFRKAGISRKTPATTIRL
jgi:hypothetical protein